MSCLDNGRYTVGSGAVGLIRASLEASVRYANSRKTFGREIGRHQLVQQKIARMVRDYEMGRLLYLRAGWMKNQGLRNTKETSLCKWFATDASFEAASEAIQIHGAYGYSDEYDVERYLRNSRGATSVASYSLRARAGAPVAMPLDWSELARLRSGNAYTLRNALQKIRRRKADPWRELYDLRQPLPGQSRRAR